MSGGSELGILEERDHCGGRRAGETASVIMEFSKLTARASRQSHRRLKQRLRPMRGLRTDETAQVLIAGHAFMQNLRRGHYELGIDAPPAPRVAAAFTDLVRAI